MEKKIYMFSEGSKDLKNLLGGKGANLCEMLNLGLPVPNGFIVTTEVCNDYLKNFSLPEYLEDSLKEYIKKLEVVTGKEFGGENTLLLSVRSGAPISMPGMMDTILNLGCNDTTVQYLAKKFSDDNFAHELYARFIYMFSDVVKEISPEKLNFTGNGREKVEYLKKVYLDETGDDFPQDVYLQLKACVESIFKSWNNERAILYREINNIDKNMGTAVNVQEMVFGNLNDKSATGVAFTRNPATGENHIYGEFLIHAQGEDIVAGTATPRPLGEMKNILPNEYDQFFVYANKLERHFRDMQDIEFTIEDSKLYILQTRNGKRSALASLKIALDLRNEGLITDEEVITRISPNSVASAISGNFNSESLKEFKVIGKGLAGSAGVAVGRVVLDSNSVENSDTILVRNETSPEDLRGMNIASGILTARGGLTSHGAVVARGLGKCCVVGCGDIKINEEKGEFLLNGTVIKEGDYISIDGYTGNIYLGRVKIDEGKLSEELIEILELAKTFKKIGVRGNCDTPRDATVANYFGGEGIGLCRTEHMFFRDDRITSVREMILANNVEERKVALLKLLPLQRDDFYQMIKIMGDKPFNIRLLDPPLHEFLPVKKEDKELLGRLMNLNLEEIDSRINSLYEHNPMLGHRGSRLAVTYPEIYAMQGRAIAEAAIAAKREKIECNIEVELPLIMDLEELRYVKKVVEDEMKLVMSENYLSFNYKIGTMIELPRACVIADKLGEIVDFFSFGTNDLTQTTLGISRDDSSKFINDYLLKNILKANPFEEIDVEGVGELVKMATEKGRSANPNILIGICGEHGGNPKSIEFFNSIPLDYVSCSAYRVPSAIVAAAQSAIREKNKK